jgi:hypothetical protein
MSRKHLIVGWTAVLLSMSASAAEDVEPPFENEELIGTETVLISDPNEPDMGVVVSGGPVLSHVQAYADNVCWATGGCTISTYEGHHPERSRALDNLASNAYGYYPTDGYAKGDRIANWTLNNWRSYRVWYVIWKQRINYNDGRGWQWMADRGSITQNHYDHVHTSFNY